MAGMSSNKKAIRKNTALNFFLKGWPLEGGLVTALVLVVVLVLIEGEGERGGGARWPLSGSERLALGGGLWEYCGRFPDGG